MEGAFQSDKAECLQEYSIRVRTSLPEINSVTCHLYPSINSPPFFKIVPEHSQVRRGHKYILFWMLQKQENSTALVEIWGWKVKFDLIPPEGAWASHATSPGLSFHLKLLSSLAFGEIIRTL